MAQLDAKSRYAGLIKSPVTDKRGREVQVLPTPPVSEEILQGYHLRQQGQRLDHLAYRYLGNGAGFWRLCDLNGAMLPDTLSLAEEIAIPTRTPPKKK